MHSYQSITLALHVDYLKGNDIHSPYYSKLLDGLQILSNPTAAISEAKPKPCSRLWKEITRGAVNLCAGFLNDEGLVGRVLLKG